MRFVLADIRSQRGFVIKDTAVGGYGQRMSGFCLVTRAGAVLRRRLQDPPSITLAYLAALLTCAGHEIAFTRREVLDGDVALVLSSLVDYRQETAWAAAARSRGLRVGFVGLAASKMHHLFAPYADFIVDGEPEAAVQRLADGDRLSGLSPSSEIADLDSLPSPDGTSWARESSRAAACRRSPGRSGRFLFSQAAAALSSVPIVLTASSRRTERAPSTASSASLNSSATATLAPSSCFGTRCLPMSARGSCPLCDAIRSRGLDLQWECETRLDRLDKKLLESMHGAGLRAVTFGVESMSPDTLRRVGRRPVPEGWPRRVIEVCHGLGIGTVGFYVLGFETDTWESVAATIDYAISLNTTLAQFKILTPYPGTPLYKRLEDRIVEPDWERFDGFTPVFLHPTLSGAELRFLLSAAYNRFYLRPSWFAGYGRFQRQWLLNAVGSLDRRASALHACIERAEMSRAVEC